MWDNRQAPVYQQCADAFHARHPDITVKITQEGWDNYWTTLTTSLISGEAPDVFVNHVSRFPEFAANGVLTERGMRLNPRVSDRPSNRASPQAEAMARHSTSGQIMLPI